MTRTLPCTLGPTGPAADAAPRDAAARAALDASIQDGCRIWRHAVAA